MMFPTIWPATYKFPVKVPSPEMIFPHRTFPFVLRTFDAMMTLAGGHDPPPPLDMKETGPPFVMLSHISTSLNYFFIKIASKSPNIATANMMYIFVFSPESHGTGSGRLFGRSGSSGTGMVSKRSRNMFRPRSWVRTLS